MLITCTNVRLNVWRAVVVEWLSSWLVDKVVLGLNPGRVTSIPDIGYLLLPSRNITEILLKRRKSSKQLNQPTKGEYLDNRTGDPAEMLKSFWACWSFVLRPKKKIMFVSCINQTEPLLNPLTQNFLLTWWEKKRGEKYWSMWIHFKSNLQLNRHVKPYHSGWIYQILMCNSWINTFQH